MSIGGWEDDGRENEPMSRPVPEFALVVTVGDVTGEAQLAGGEVLDAAWNRVLDLVRLVAGEGRHIPQRH